MGGQSALTCFSYTGIVGENYMKTNFYTIKLKLSVHSNKLQWEVEQ